MVHRDKSMNLDIQYLYFSPLSQKILKPCPMDVVETKIIQKLCCYSPFATRPLLLSLCYSPFTHVGVQGEGGGVQGAAQHPQVQVLPC